MTAFDTAWGLLKAPFVDWEDMPEKAKQEMFGLMGGTVKKANIGLIIWRT